MAPATLKRKLQGPTAARKKSKVTLDGLPWKTVSRPKETGLDGDDGILDLEEVDDVEVVYEQTESGRVAKFNVIASTSKKQPAPQRLKEPIVADVEEEVEEEIPSEEIFDSENLLQLWHPYGLNSHLLRSLHANQFLSPTPIQARALPAALSGRDVVGVAETGSGKTLAYGLPILHHILAQPNRSKKTKRHLKALILAPTRELALQVAAHLTQCLQVTPSDNNKDAETETKEEGDDDARVPPPATKGGAKNGKGNAKNGKGKGKAQESNLKPKGAPLVSIAAIVGGMSAQKQRRVLDRGVEVLVATPGRLWDILEDDDELAKQIRGLKFLVVDEADRMVEAGHFEELEHILRLTFRESNDEKIETEFEDPADVDVVKTVKPGDEMQTFVFSATLSKDLQRNVTKRARPRIGGKKEKGPTTLDDLLLRLDFRDPEPEVIDISPEGGVVSSLKEGKIECLSAEKDVYLYYFLLRYPGRSLVFLSSIDGIRRLMPLAELLGLKAFPLHSQLEQRQRLKNLDRFKSTPNSVLLATDIAARGLDIPAVDHVIHYQIPRSADAYVHRNGRTARAMRKGFSMLMCGPDERRVVRALLGSLGRQETDILEMSIELNMLDKLKARVALARKIDSAHHKVKKENHDKNWMKEAAEAMELQLDSDFVSDDEDDQDRPTKFKVKSRNVRTAAMKAELKRMLAVPLIAKGVSTRYITSGTRPIVDDLISGACALLSFVVCILRELCLCVLLIFSAVCRS
ncbi:DEAD-domain-containing protein [Athelia psychrophila]|uniref:RNA helicase n=1 Tax=Athelia psychrophila TaxID=1759441 RepID=A0A166E6E3_9AGAM|nr:DEAD-domain-containing protein [Fibularhizoctonia sp. CBS 109695]